MNEQEQKDIEILKAAIQDVQNTCFRLLTSLNSYDRKSLDMAGYNGKSNAEAMQLAFRDQQKRIEKLNREFLRKYPD
jgi:hypothetical protein